MKKLFSILGSVLLAFGWLLLMPVPVAHAANNCEWNGSVDANWSTVANWSSCGGGVPQNGDTVVLPSVVVGNKTMTNDIAGTLTLAQLYVADGYNLTGNAITISGTMVFQSTGSTVNVSALNFANASTGVSLQIDGTGNTISTSVGITLPAGDFNAYVNADFVAPAFTGSMTNFNKWGAATFTSASGSTFTTAGGVNLEAGNFACSSATCAGNSANFIAQYSGGKLLFTADVTLPNNIGLNYLSGATAVGLELNNSVGVSLTGTLSSNGSAQVQLGSSSNFQTIGSVNLISSLEIIGNSASTSNYLESSAGLTNSGELSCSNVTCKLDTAIATYNGVIRGKAGSIIQPSLDDSLGSTVGNTVIESGAELFISDGSDLTIPENLNVVGTGIASSGAIHNLQTTGNRTFTGTVTLAGDTTIYAQDADAVGPAANLIFSGVVAGSGDLTLTTSGYTGYIWFDGSSANTYSGTTKINDGQVVLVKDPGAVAIPGNLEINSSVRLAQLQDNGGEQIADTSAVTLSESGSFNAEWQVGDNETVGSVAGDGDIYIVGGKTLHTGNNNSTTSYGGKITTSPNGSGTVDKVGTGTFTLTGTPTATFVPNYTVNGGVLSVQTDFSLANFVVNNTSTIKGSGMTGATTINTGGHINVGNSPGCMTVASLTMTSGAHFDEELAGTTACTQYDRTTVTGNADLNDASLDIAATFTPPAGTIFTIIQAGSITGTFHDLPNNSEFTIAGIRYRINYTDTQVNLTVLGGTLAPTGQSTGWILIVATLLIVSSAAGLLIVWRRKQLFPRIK